MSIRPLNPEDLNLGSRDGKGQAKQLTPEQIELLIHALPAHLQLWGRICWTTGCRGSEARELRGTDVSDTGELCFRSTKNGTDRNVTPLDDELVPELVTYAQERGEKFLFPSPRYPWKPVSRAHTHDAVIQAAQAIGLKGVSSHTFRRSFVRYQRNMGATYNEIQKYTGHKDLGELLRYD